MTFDILPFARSRELIVDAFHMAAKRYPVHGFLDVDVTLPRRILRGTSGTDRRPLTFTGFAVASFARAIHAHPTVQAYRDLRNRLVFFHDVDVSTVVEPRPSAQPLPQFVRRSDSRSVREISEEITGCPSRSPAVGLVSKKCRPGNPRSAFRLGSVLPWSEAQSGLGQAHRGDH
jgi:hypothetical protein